MTTDQHINRLPDCPWVGGFAESNPAYAYPEPDLTSLPMLDNLANINLLYRQQGVKWPEFSWETESGNADSRCFQMFSPFISRIGYTAAGRVYSIICPQQGIWIDKVGCLNVEVTVTGQRGWVNETTRELAADMTVEGKIWFSPSAHQSWLVQALWAFFKDTGLPFPFQKENAIRVTTHKLKHPDEPIFPVRFGETTRFASPDFARHRQEAWTVGNVEVEIGPIQKTDSNLVNEFNRLIMELFNISSGNMLQAGNILSWNVWFEEPMCVNKEEWRNHAERWRLSIDEDHGSPTGPGTVARYCDGTPFCPIEAFTEEKIVEIFRWIWKNLAAKPSILVTPIVSVQETYVYVAQTSVSDVVGSE